MQRRPPSKPNTTNNLPGTRPSRGPQQQRPSAVASARPQRRPQSAQGPSDTHSQYPGSPGTYRQPQNIQPQRPENAPLTNHSPPSYAQYNPGSPKPSGAEGSTQPRISGQRQRSRSTVAAPRPPQQHSTVPPKQPSQRPRSRGHSGQPQQHSQPASSNLSQSHGSPRPANPSTQNPGGSERPQNTRQRQTQRPPSAARERNIAPDNSPPPLPAVRTSLEQQQNLRAPPSTQTVISSQNQPNPPRSPRPPTQQTGVGGDSGPRQNLHQRPSGSAPANHPTSSPSFQDEPPPYSCEDPAKPQRPTMPRSASQPEPSRPSPRPRPQNQQPPLPRSQRSSSSATAPNQDRISNAHEPGVQQSAVPEPRSQPQRSPRLPSLPSNQRPLNPSNTTQPGGSGQHSRSLIARPPSASNSQNQSSDSRPAGSGPQVVQRQHQNPSATTPRRSASASSTSTSNSSNPQRGSSGQPFQQQHLTAHSPNSDFQQPNIAGGSDPTLWTQNPRSPSTTKSDSAFQPLLYPPFQQPGISGVGPLHRNVHTSPPMVADFSFNRPLAMARMGQQDVDVEPRTTELYTVAASSAPAFQSPEHQSTFQTQNVAPAQLTPQYQEGFNLLGYVPPELLLQEQPSFTGELVMPSQQYTQPPPIITTPDGLVVTGPLPPGAVLVMANPEPYQQPIPAQYPSTSPVAGPSNSGSNVVPTPGGTQGAAAHHHNSHKKEYAQIAAKVGLAVGKVALKAALASVL